MEKLIVHMILPSIFGLVHNCIGLSKGVPLVHTNIGLIRGLRATDGDYTMFLGIPYATVNKSNPFGPSIPHMGFKEVFEANDDSAVCPQIEEFNNTIIGTLDCLHLNIYVPNSANSKNLLPALVYIYGGLFMIGFSGRYLYGPRFFVKQNIILVTFNYRVGPYGFMCLETPDVIGNQGLKDQQLVLKWIKDNIKVFGGDPNKITISGNISGGSSVDLHLLYSKRKLFDKVIMQSGTALHPWSMLKPDKFAALKLSYNLGYRATDTEDALAFLSTVDSNLLIASTSKLGLKFRPCVEKGYKNIERFIYDHPINIKPPNLENLTIVLGCNSDEALAAYEVMPPEDYKDLFYDNINDYFNFNTEQLIEMKEYIKHFYIGDETISSQVKQGIIKLNSDFYFNYPVVRSIRKYLDSGAKNIYFYLFAYSGGRNFLKDRFNVSVKGAAHADELGYLFDIYYMKKMLTPKDKLIIDRVTTLWANFVKTRNPTPQKTVLLPVQWPVVTKDFLHYLYINVELKVKTRIFKSRMAFWDLFYKLNEKAQVGYQENTEKYTCDAKFNTRYGFLNN